MSAFADTCKLRGLYDPSIIFPGDGFSYPPKDYAKWGELCFQWAKHCAEKYGLAEASSWYWEVWNEPNISYWRGTPAEFHNGKRLYIMLWHYHDDDLPGPDATVECKVNGTPNDKGFATVRHFRIDADHRNAYEVWKQMGSPSHPTREQITQLEKSSQLALLTAPTSQGFHDIKIGIPMKLPRQAVSLLEIDLP